MAPTRRVSPSREQGVVVVFGSILRITGNISSKPMNCGVEDGARLVNRSGASSVECFHGLHTYLFASSTRGKDAPNDNLSGLASAWKSVPTFALARSIIVI